MAELPDRECAQDGQRSAEPDRANTEDRGRQAGSLRVVDDDVPDRQRACDVCSGDRRSTGVWGYWPRSQGRSALSALGGGPGENAQGGLWKRRSDFALLARGHREAAHQRLTQENRSDPGTHPLFLMERNASYPQIYTDGRPLPKELNPSWNGSATGHWEGDTLVVETAGFREGQWLDRAGSPLTEAAKMTEKFRRP